MSDQDQVNATLQRIAHALHAAEDGTVELIVEDSEMKALVQFVQDKMDQLTGDEKIQFSEALIQASRESPDGRITVNELDPHVAGMLILVYDIARITGVNRASLSSVVASYMNGNSERPRPGHRTCFTAGAGRRTDAEPRA